MLFHSSMSQTAQSLADHDVMAENMLSVRNRPETRGVGSSLRSPPGPLSILLLLVSLSLTPCSSTSLLLHRTLFMSAWIALFHYTLLPAHYQSYNCFNNRTPPPPVLLFPWQPTMRRARKREQGRKIAEAGKKTWMRGWECHPLTSGSLCKEGNLHYKSPSFSKVKLANQKCASSSTAHHAGSLRGKDVILICAVLFKKIILFQGNEAKIETEPYQQVRSLHVLTW